MVGNLLAYMHQRAAGIPLPLHPATAAETPRDWLSLEWALDHVPLHRVALT